MSRVGRLGAVALAALGIYYAFRGSTAFLHVRDVTNRWIELSGDPDFSLDFALFATLIGFGAVAVFALGAATAICGIATALGKSWGSRYWISLAIAAPFVHFPWFLYRLVATGRLPRADAALIQRTVAIRFGVICATYVLVWALTRVKSATRTAG